MSFSSEKRPVAFFDIDGTVFRSSLLVELVNSLSAKGVFPEDVKDHYLPAYYAWQKREGSYENYIESLVDAFLKNIKGVSYSTFVELGEVVVNEQSKRVYTYTRDLILKLKKQGYFLVAISQSPKLILDPFCREYGFDVVYGRMYDVGPTDRFTGTVDEVYLIENKAKIANRVFDKYPVLRERSLAVGDTEADIPLLEVVTKAICFNPNKHLYNEALRRSWDVVVERKDVIYRIS